MSTFPPTTSVFNDGYIAETYETYRRDPSAVDESWRQFFRTAESLAGIAGTARPDDRLLRKAAAAASLVEAIREYGHLAVQLDPLGTPPPGAPELTAEFHGVSEGELADVPASALGFEGGTAADVVEQLRGVYCNAIAVEFTHLGSEGERAWWRQAMEAGMLTKSLDKAEKVAVLKRLTEVDGLERFLGRAYQGYKRFSVEGTDVMVPMLDEAIARSASHGARQVVLAMAHRGRINVLVHVMGMSYAEMFGEFEGRQGDASAYSSTGDVKYHLGFTHERQIGDATLSLDLVPNPSHLEVVNPIMSGMARAWQRMPDDLRKRDERGVLPICIHGDAAFPGEGVVPETFNISRLRGYTVGGTLHLIVNNQVGFTTDPIDARSTRYASDPAKGFEVPVLHVNADDAEACLIAVRLAVAYRDRFAKDVLIDLVGYRRHGHNETDEPAFTQPKLYERVRAHPTPREVWGARLVRERVLTDEEVKAMDADFSNTLSAVHKAMKAEPNPEEKAVRGTKAMAVVEDVSEPMTAVAVEQLENLNTRLLTRPESFKGHPRLMKTLERRRDALHAGAIDWGHSEALAFGSLLQQGVGVRISGQDVERGTFAHRNAVLHDVESGATYTPLADLPGVTVPFEIYNSALSETAVMGFEYGFSCATERDLVLWEAQYGDFVNVAQPIIDQFISADRAKWGSRSGLVLLLPHGYEGGGPEHSSARLERFLQLCAEQNMCVAYPSTPAQYFHILRRQAMRSERTPLILMQPKSLLRLPAAASKLEELREGGFRAVIDDATVEGRREGIRRLVLCTAKMYYDLLAAKGDNKDVALVRVDELYPWPGAAVAATVDKYPNLEDVVWAQEEPKNMGAWSFVAPQLRVATGNMLTIRYIGRQERASPAEGYAKAHEVEQKRIVTDVLTVAPSNAKRKMSKV
ncbi:MAG: 2-oxoglutarate dehydrogenase, subunit [Gemmatimonadetes bacterium]|nr:2-oxoglutarate dehydrogenase, subunit [Gemmatimonadota bacterium]